MELLNICGLKKSYFIENSRTMKKEKVEVIKNISLQIKENESVSSEMVMELLVRLQRELNVTMILVTHDREIADYCNRVIKIVDGKIDTLSREA